ncbi:MAG: hypothetical protein R3F30_06705 [Planctomycetota bacterium]
MRSPTRSAHPVLVLLLALVACDDGSRTTPPEPREQPREAGQDAGPTPPKDTEMAPEDGPRQDAEGEGEHRPETRSMRDEILAQTWKARTEALPDGGSRLRVEGVLQVTSSGFRCSLRRAEPQGINAKVLLLELSVVPPDGPALAVLTDEKVDHVEDSAEPFDEVQVLLDGEVLKSIVPGRAPR